MTASDAPPDELGRLVRRGVSWTLASQGAVQVMALLTSVVIAVFLSPNQVGLASEAVVFVGLALVIGDLGFGAVIVQRPKLTETEISTLFWAGIALGLVLTLCGVALSPLVADLYGNQRVESLFAVMSITFLLTAPGLVQGALLTKELRFRSLELRTIAATTSSCSIAIVLAALGAGPWAIVAQTIAMAGLSTALLWRSSAWRPKLVFSVTALREFREFSSHVLGSKLVSWANGNVDNLLVGRFLGAPLLGAYSLAFAVALTPVNRVAVPITSVLFPAFTRLREADRMSELWLRATRVLALVVVPAMLGLIVVAPDFVRAVFGERWRHAAPVMQLLAGVGLTQTLTALNDGILTALAHTRLLFRFRAVLSVVTLAAFAGGLPWGITGGAIGYLIVSIVLQPVYVLLTVRAVGIPLVAWVRSVSSVFLCGTIMLIVIFCTREALISAGVAIGIRLVALVALGAMVYLAAVAWRIPAIREDIRAVRARRRSSGLDRDRLPID